MSVRTKVTLPEIDAAIDRLRAHMHKHFEQIGDGVFIHPHEITGCLFGQLLKLSAESDASIYDNDTTKVETRCLKIASPAIFGVVSLIKNRNTKTQFR